MDGDVGLTWTQQQQQESRLTGQEGRLCISWVCWHLHSPRKRFQFPPSAFVPMLRRTNKSISKNTPQWHTGQFRRCRSMSKTVLHRDWKSCKTAIKMVCKWIKTMNCSEKSMWFEVLSNKSSAMMRSFYIQEHWNFPVVASVDTHLHTSTHQEDHIGSQMLPELRV